MFVFHFQINHHNNQKEVVNKSFICFFFKN